MREQIVLVQEEPRGPSILIEVPVTAGQQRVQFPDIQQLRSTVDSAVILKAMRLIPDSVLVAGVTSGTTNATVTELQKITVVIKAEGWEKGQYIPALAMNDFLDGAGAIVSRFNTTRFANWRHVDWSQCYLQFANNNPSVGNYVVIFEVEYLKLNKSGVPIIGAQ